MRHFADHPIWARNPKFAMLPKEAEYAHPARVACEAERGHRSVSTNNYILPDMVAKVVNGMPTPRAMAWAQDQIALAVKGQLKSSG